MKKKARERSVQAQILAMHRDDAEPRDPLPSAHDETGRCRHCGSEATSLVMPQDDDAIRTFGVACRMCGRIVCYVDGRGRVLNPVAPEAIVEALGTLRGEERIIALSSYLFGEENEPARMRA